MGFYNKCKLQTNWSRKNQSPKRTGVQHYPSTNDGQKILRWSLSTCYSSSFSFYHFLNFKAAIQPFQFMLGLGLRPIYVRSLMNQSFYLTTAKYGNLLRSPEDVLLLKTFNINILSIFKK